MIIGKIVGTIFKKSASFFSSKAGKATLAAVAAAGVTTTAVGAGKAAAAGKKNQQAKDIQDRALKKHEDALKRTQQLLKNLKYQEEETIEEIKRFLEITEKINRCPNICEFDTKAELPRISYNELKELSNNFEMALAGISGAGLSGLAGLAFCGLSCVGILSFTSLGCGAVLCIKGNKLYKQATKNLNEAKKLEQQVESIVNYYAKLQDASKKLQESLKVADNLYKNKLDKFEKLVDLKNDYFDFSDDEKLLTKNCFKLTSLLANMCNTKLAKRTEDEEIVNVQEVELVCSKANLVMNEKIANA